jgi:type III pantothenate kinase
MLLADIGNTRTHIYNGKEVIHLSHQEAIREYAHRELKYITVKHQLKEQLATIEGWGDVSDKIKIENEYSTMGIDRKALCLSYENGIFVSAGTAITVDVVESGIYRGGFILLGLRAYIEAYANISPALKIELDKKIDKVETAYGLVAPCQVKGVEARCSKIVPDQFGEVFFTRM